MRKARIAMERATLGEKRGTRCHEHRRKPCRFAECEPARDHRPPREVVRIAREGEWGSRAWVRLHRPQKQKSTQVLREEEACNRQYSDLAGAPSHPRRARGSPGNRTRRNGGA